MQDPTDWDDEALNYDSAPDHGLADQAVRSAWRSLLLGMLPSAPATVADLGCGTGTLASLLAIEGYVVDGLERSSEMLERARRKTAGLSGVRILSGDANEPPLPRARYDVVLSRHVLWAMNDPQDALRRWAALRVPAGRLVLIEGLWSNGVGLPAAATLKLVQAAGLNPELHLLTDPALWGAPIPDERYAIVAT
jgi:SAM-dependent methyltransferase